MSEAEGSDIARMEFFSAYWARKMKVARELYNPVTKVETRAVMMALGRADTVLNPFEGSILSGG